MAAGMSCRPTARPSRWRGAPVLSLVLRALGEAWPADVPRDTLIARAFRTRHIDELPTARELRVKSAGCARDAGRAGAGGGRAGRRSRWCRWCPPPGRSRWWCWHAGRGEAWCRSWPCWAMGSRGRVPRLPWRWAPASAPLQRALDARAAADGKVQAFGRGRARRWLSTPVPGFTTTLVTPHAAAESLGWMHVSTHEESPVDTATR